MKAKLKLFGLIISFIIAILLIPNQASATEITEVANSEQLIKALEDALNDENVTAHIKITENIELAETINIEESVIIDGNNKTITSTTRKAFELHTGTFEIKNAKIVNTAKRGRCIDARDGDVAIKLSGVTLQTTGKSAYNQTLSIGGNFANPITVNLTNTKILTENPGYGITTFNPVNLAINNSEVTGYAALYMKGQNNSAGSAGSTVIINNSTLVGINNYSGYSNAFGTIVFEDHNINMNITNSKLRAEGVGDASQVIIGEHISLGNSEKPNKVTISGNTIITAQEGIAGMKNENAVVTLYGGVTSNIEIPKELLPIGAMAKSENGKFVVYEPHNIVVNDVEGGIVEVDKTSALAGDVITITVKAKDGYKLKSLKAITAADTELEIVDGKFIMPNLGAIIVAEFEKIPTEIDFIVSEDKTENNNIGIVETEKVKETLDTSLKTDSKLNDKVEEARKDGKNVRVEVKVEELDNNNVKEDEKQKILQTIKSNQKVHQYFDISVLVTANQEELGKITQLTEKIKFSIKLSDDLIKQGRKFYILKLHNDEVDRIEAILNGTNLEFETDQFSTFALAYEDSVEEITESEEKDDTPKTGTANMPVYVWISIAGIALVGIITTKKSNRRRK